MRRACLLLAALGSAAALPRPFVVLSGLAVAAAACTSNSDCSSGEFCNADEPSAECEACYYPGDLPRSVDACARYEDACGAACDGSGGGNSGGGDSEDGDAGTGDPDGGNSSGDGGAEDGSGDGDAEDGSGGNSDPDGGNLPEGCCSEVMEPHQQCVYPTDSTYDRDEVKEPVVSTEALEFATHDDCAAHDAYADCVGETAERCQWVFLSSPKGGFCRVDPISKCLELGNCVCNTEDFQGGGADLGGGIVFHAPISVTPRDVAPGSRVTSYSEAATPPVAGADELHPRDEAFFVSRVDFTAKALTYELSSPFPADSTVLFKLHHLYRDQRLRGTLYDGPGLSVTVASEADGSAELAVNGHAYAFPAAALKTWHCNQIAVTPSRVYVRDLAIARDLDAEAAPAAAPRAVLGPASAELFDVRVYAGALSADEIATVGARCGDPGALKMLVDLETEFLRGGCSPDVDGVPSNQGIQTYGSGAFGTLWVAPATYGTEWWTADFGEVPTGTNANFNPSMFDELVAGNLYDMTEEMLDLDHYFQEQKMLSHVWERYYFETDMMAVNLAPYSAYASASEVPGHSARDWNNPCRFLHQHNNGWLFPFYGSSIEKWEPTDDAAVFDLRNLYRNRGHSGYGFVVHEVFHGFQGELCGTYGTCGGRWLAESTASFGCDYNFPGADTYTAPYVVTPPIPLNMFFDVEPSTHFIDLGISDGVRGGHIYGAFLFWSFLANHAGQPGAVGKMYSVDLGAVGELLKLRALLFAEGLDLGDVFANFVAHLRTVDDPLFADEISKMIETSFESYSRGIWAASEDFGCPATCGTCEVAGCADSVSWTYKGNSSLNCAWVAKEPGARCALEGDGIFGSSTLEDLQTTVAVSGATAGSVAAPAASRPGPFGWNALKLDGFDAGDFVTITVAWDDLVTDDATANPAALNKVHASCVNDRFFSARVVRLGADGVRTYWKMDGKNPDPVTVEISAGDVVHVLLVPTPPADYVDHEKRIYDTFEPVPHYGYAYEVAVADSGSETAAADMAYGVLAYADRGDWFETRCTCLTLSDDLSDCWAPRFAAADDGVGAVVGETTTTVGFEGGGAAKWDPCKKKKTKKRCKKKKNKRGKKKCSWNPRKQKCKLRKKKKQ